MDCFLDHLSELDNITKYLKREISTLSDVLAPFETVKEQYPTTKKRHSGSAAIVDNPKFESAVIRLQRQIVNELDAEELNLVQKLRLQRDSTNEREVFMSLA